MAVRNDRGGRPPAAFGARASPPGQRPVPLTRPTWPLGQPEGPTAGRGPAGEPSAKGRAGPTLHRAAKGEPTPAGTRSPRGRQPPARSRQGPVSQRHRAVAWCRVSAAGRPLVVAGHLPVSPPRTRAVARHPADGPAQPQRVPRPRRFGLRRQLFALPVGRAGVAAAPPPLPAAAPPRAACCSWATGAPRERRLVLWAGQSRPALLA